MLTFLKRKNTCAEPARRVYGALLEKTRAPGFYADMAVPDTFAGRFDLLTLHVCIVINRLNAEGGQGRAFNQALFDAVFADMDQTMREIGIGDMGVPKRMRRMMKAFNGRIHAYDAAFADDGAFKDAMRRNLYAHAPELPAETLDKMKDYARAFAASLASLSLTDIMEGRITTPQIHKKAA